MSESPEQTPAEPTLADVMTVLQALAANMTTGLADTRAEMRQGFADMSTKLDNAVETMRIEARAQAAGTAARIDAVQQVVISVKQDIARHLADPHAHDHPNAA